MSNNKLIEKARSFFNRFRKLSNNELSKVSGAGNEPEEFDWKTKGYETPVKEQDPKSGWAFGPVGNKRKEDIFKK